MYWNKRAEVKDLVYLETTLDHLLATGQRVVCSDGNARSNKTSFYPLKKTRDLAQRVELAWLREGNIDRGVVGDHDLKRKFQAEVLVEGSLTLSAVERFIAESERNVYDLYDAGAGQLQQTSLVHDPAYFPPKAYG